MLCADLSLLSANELRNSSPAWLFYALSDPGCDVPLLSTFSMMNSLSELHVLLWPPGLGSSETHATSLSLPSFLHVTQATNVQKGHAARSPVSFCFSVPLPERSAVLHSSAQLWTSGGLHTLDHQVKAG